MEIKAKKSYTYKEVCKIKDKAIEYGIRAGIREIKKFISDHNKYMLAFNKSWGDQQIEKDKEYYEWKTNMLYV